MIDQEFRKAWLPYFRRSVQREASFDEFDFEVEEWLPLLLEVSLPRLTGQKLGDVVQRKGVTAGSLDGLGWRESKVPPVSWYDELARVLTKVEDFGVWPDGLLDAYIAMIPKTDGDATPLGQRPLSVLPTVYRVWASARLFQLEDWFPDVSIVRYTWVLGAKDKPNHLTPDSLHSFPQDIWSSTASSGKVNDWENREHVVLNLFSKN